MTPQGAAAHDLSRTYSAPEKVGRGDHHQNPRPWRCGNTVLFCEDWYLDDYLPITPTDRADRDDESLRMS